MKGKSLIFCNLQNSIDVTKYNHLLHIQSKQKEKQIMPLTSLHYYTYLALLYLLR